MSCSDAKNLQNYDYEGEFSLERKKAWIPVLNKQLNSNSKYLEIGVKDSKTASWIAKEFLSGEEAVIYGIDIEERYRKKFYHNLKVSGFRGKSKYLLGSSRQSLKNIPDNFFDLIYIDGSHTRMDVLYDSVVAWEKLKVGGIIIFDDYLFAGFHANMALKPTRAIDNFIDSYLVSIDEITQFPLHYDKSKPIDNSQLLIKKGVDFCDRYDLLKKFQCTVIGQFYYFWSDKSLIRIKDKKKIHISPEDLLIIEAVLNSGLKYNKKPFYKTSIPFYELSSEKSIKTFEKLGFQLVDNKIFKFNL